MLPGFSTQIVSPFPNPPEYAQQYTNDRIDNGSAPAPPHPITEFCVFGEEYRLEDDVVAPLTNSGVRELYTSKVNWKSEMKKLNRSAVIAFFDLVEVLIRAPDHPLREEKMNDLHTIFINMHHLINEFRPVQARDGVRVLQERQIAEVEGICLSFRKYLSDGRVAVEDQFLKIKKKLDKPQQPSELSKVSFQGGLLRSITERTSEHYIPNQANQKKTPSTTRDAKTFITREDGPPSVSHLLIRQFNDVLMKHE